MKARIVVLLVALALVAGVVFRMGGKEAGGGPQGHGGEGRALAVKTVPVEVRDFPRVVELPGTLEAVRQAAVSARVGGALQKQYVQEGDSVREGQLLFDIDARAATARIGQGEASLAGARAEVAEAGKKLERLEPLMASGYISQQEYDDAVLAREAARTRVAAARAELDTARLDAGYAAIRAPFSGRVGRITVRPGDLVQAGAALTTLTQAGSLEARAGVAEQDWPALAAARAAGRVAADLFLGPGAVPVARGELVFVDTQLDAASGAVPIKVRLAGTPAGLLPGQGVRVRLHLGVEAGARVVPEAALQHAQDGTYVYVVRDGKAVQQNVTVLRALDGLLALEGALRAGEAVLVEIPQRLKAGGAVRLEDAKPEGAPRGPHS